MNDITNSGEEAIFQLISASLTIRRNAKIHSQGAILKSFLSETVIQNSKIYDITVGSASIEITQSQMTLESTEIYNVQNPGQLDFILVFLDSSMTLSNISFSNSTSVLFRSQKSSVVANEISLVNITDASHLFEIFDSYNTSIGQVSISNDSVTENEFFSISKSTNISFEGFNFADIPKVILGISNSVVTQIRNCVFRNSTEALSIQSSTVKEIRNTTFEENGSSSDLRGGAVDIQDSDVTITNSTFSKNKATKGAGIYFG